jgi:hypothetical protein
MTPADPSSRLVEAAQLVGVAEIAQRCEVAKPTVCAWRERHAAFPKPVAHLYSGPVYLWPEVKAWRTAHTSGNTP